MKKLVVALGFAGILAAQGPASPPVRMIRSTGEASISVRPDQAKLTVGVVTQASTAQEAASQNASQADAVLNQLRQVLGPNADVKTVSYSITPNYQYPKEGGPPTLIGFTASNSLQVTTADLAIVGRLIDTTAQAGANNVGGLQFTLRDPEPVRAQALAAAAKQARAHAEAVASGLGVRAGAVISAQEGVAVRIQPLEARGAAAATPTPIVTGLVEVQATVTVEVEIM